MARIVLARSYSLPRPKTPEGLREVAEHKSTGGFIVETNYSNNLLAKAYRDLRFDDDGYPIGKPKSDAPAEIWAIWHNFNLLKRLRSEGAPRDSHKVEERLCTGINRLLAQVRTAINTASRDLMRIAESAEKLKIDRQSKGLTDDVGLKEVESLSDEELEQWVDPD